MSENGTSFGDFFYKENCWTREKGFVSTVNATTLFPIIGDKRVEAVIVPPEIDKKRNLKECRRPGGNSRILHKILRLFFPSDKRKASRISG